MIYDNVLSDLFNGVKEKLNAVIHSINSIQRYIGTINSTDNTSLTYKIDFLMNNLYQYEMCQEDIAIDTDSDGNYTVNTVNFISGSKVYVKIYNRPDDETPQEVAEIENEDVEKLDDYNLKLNKDILDELFNEFEDLYAKVFFVTKKKIELS